MMSEVQAIVKTENKELVYDKIINSIKKSDLNKTISYGIKKLSEQLVRLHKKKWDGIWIRIVANFMLVARVKNIDLIVGNPPWVKWEFLPQAYAEKIKKLCVERHLFSGQTYMGAISLNICALISNVTASSWLSKNGILAFLMPQTLMTQDSYSGFRNFFINFKSKKRMYLQKLDDWTLAGNPFIDTTEKFMTYYYGKTPVDYFKKGIPIRVMKKKRGVSILGINTRQSYSEVKNCFEISSKRAYQMDKKRTGYTSFEASGIKRKTKFDLIIGECDYKARSGVEFTPAEIYFMEPVKKVSKKNSYLFEPSQFKNSKYKSLINIPIQLGTKYIRPVVKSPKIVPFGFKNNNNNYCIFPYEEGHSKSINEKKLLKENPELFKYLLNNKNLISKQSKRSLLISRGTAFYSLSKVGDYTFAPYKVTFRDNTKLSASVVQTIKTPWGDKILPVCAKHCPYISQDKEGRMIDEEESYYICGILNTPIVREYFLFTYSTRSYSINFNIKMPLYERTNKYHKKMMELAKEATLKKPSIKIYHDLEACYLKLCKET